MTESEGGGCEAVQDGGVHLEHDHNIHSVMTMMNDHLWVVIVVVSVGDWEDVQLRHVVTPQHQGQPLVVGHVLEISIVKKSTI